MTLLAVFAIVLPRIAPRELPSVPQTTDPNWDVVGTITLAPEGAYCRQLALDNNTGDISEIGRVRCIEIERERTEAASSDNTAARLDSIRKSFSKR